MSIDWKKLSKTEVYRNLKAAYLCDVIDATRRALPLRDKEELNGKWRHIFYILANHSYRSEVSPETILAMWEERRNGSWWLGHYSQSFLKVIPSDKPSNVVSPNSNYFVSFWYTKKEKFQALRKHKMLEAKRARKQLGKKPRWNMEAKRRGTIRREYLKSL